MYLFMRKDRFVDFFLLYLGGVEIEDTFYWRGLEFAPQLQAYNFQSSTQHHRVVVRSAAHLLLSSYHI
ncbi:hypothetical protein L2E82_24515 [Cichorium intybus]|uniref:Uncharacterized protein n=1 Tax=Cichorium intybus TaxID=13427 RepID=A0ACB9E121_CICIN|nr:hypothetical protein L2E82_24515 [Cichorium intybus]